jgi:hypothetical protein
VTAVPVDPPAIQVRVLPRDGADAVDYEGINASFGPEFERHDGSSEEDEYEAEEEEAEVAVEGSGEQAGTGRTSFRELTGRLVAAEPAEGCEPLSNAEAVQGGVALLDRGRCTFLDKVLNAQVRRVCGRERRGWLCS